VALPDPPAKEPDPDDALMASPPSVSPVSDSAVIWPDSHPITEPTSPPSAAQPDAPITPAPVQVSGKAATSNRDDELRVERKARTQANAHGGATAAVAPPQRPEPTRSQRQVPTAGTDMDSPVADTVAESPALRTAWERPRPSATADTGERTPWVKYLIALSLLLALVAGMYYLYTSLFGAGKRTVYPVEGVVMFQGKPAVGARVTFIPIDKSKDRYFPTGKVGEDGSFKLTTYEPDDGAPVGKYQVTVVRGQIDADEYAELQKTMSTAEITKLMQKMARDPLAQKYANGRNSGLTAEVTAQATNKLDPFILK
jgi:hypothetical protein